MKKRLRWFFAALMALAPLWLLATESGLHVAMRGAEVLTGGRLSLSGGAGRLLDTFSLDQAIYTHEAATVRIENVALNLRLSRLLLGRLQAESLEVGALTVTTHPHPAPAERRPLTVRMPLRLAVEQGALQKFLLRLDDGTRAWGLSEVKFAARWRGEWIVIGALSATTAEAGPVSLSGRLAMVDDLLKLEKISIEGPGQLQVDGALALTGAAVNDLQLDWKRLTWIGVARPDWLDGTDGRLNLQGPWENYGWTLAAMVSAVDISGPLNARGRGSLRGISIQRARLDTLGGHVQGSGRLDWDAGLRTDLELELRQINPGLRFADWDGQINGLASLRGQWRETVPDLEFQAQLRDSQLRGYPLALRVNGRTQNRQLMLHEFLLESGVSSLRGQGRLLPDFALSAELRSPELQSLWAGLSGSANVQARLQGTPQAPKLQALGSAQEVVYNAKAGRVVRAARITLDARLAPEAQSDFQLQLEEIDAGVSFSSLTLSGAGARAKHQLRLDLKGENSVSALVLSGGQSDNESSGGWRGRLSEARFAVGADSAWTLEEPAAIEFERNRLNVEPACLSNGAAPSASAGGNSSFSMTRSRTELQDVTGTPAASRACAQWQSAPGRQRLGFRLRDFDLQQLRPLLPAEWKLSGALSGTASLNFAQGELKDLRADISGSAGALEGGGATLAFGPGQFRVQPDGERLHATLRLTPGGGEIAGEAWLAAGPALLDRPVLGDLRVALPDLAWLPVLSPEIAGASGTLQAQLSLSGTPRSPSLEGRVDLSGGRVLLATPGIEFTDIVAAFESGKKTPLSVSVSANSGGGRLQLQGGLDALRPKLKGKFTLTGENAQWINTPDIRAWVSPDLQLVLADGVTRLTGELKVPRAQITPRELSGGGVAVSNDQVLVNEDAAEAPRGLNLWSELRIVLGDDVRFDGLGLKTRLEGGITANDQRGSPTRGRGELRLIGGRYKAYGQDLIIETGRLLFNGGPVTDPVIELSAYRQPDPKVRVGLRARGALEAPSFSLYSEPAMSQEEQLSWLVLGRPLTDTLQSGQGNELNSAALSLGFSGGEYLAQQLAPRVGLDEVTVGTRPGETTQLARFTIGKYLSPKLFVSYGFGLFQPGQFFRLQYDLGRGFKLSGESGLEQGGDLLYTIER